MRPKTALARAIQRTEARIVTQAIRLTRNHTPESCIGYNTVLHRSCARLLELRQRAKAKG